MERIDHGFSHPWSEGFRQKNIKVGDLRWKILWKNSCWYVFHCSGRTNLNLQVRSDKVDRYVRVELSHELSEKHTHMTRAFIHSVRSMCPDHVLRTLQISTCKLRRGQRTAPQPELQWRWPRSPVAPLTLPWQTIDPYSAQIWAPYLHCCCSFCTDG